MNMPVLMFGFWMGTVTSRLLTRNVLTTRSLGPSSSRTTPARLASSCGTARRTVRTALRTFVSTRLLTLRWLGAVHRVNATRKLIDEQVGPLALSVIQRATACATAHCSDHGRCASLGGNVRDGGRTGGGAATPPACVCDDGWSGAQCGQHT